MQKLIKISSLVFLCLMLWTLDLVSYSDGPPEGRTGAPGELTCYNGNCHNSFQLNSGPGTPAIELNLPDSAYMPDSVYTIRTRIRHDDQQRFGFQLTAYDPHANGSAGMLILPVDSMGMELVNTTSREYIRHSDAIEATDSASWTFEWKAPPAGTGDLTMYAAFLAANGNGNRQGDYVYTHSLALTEKTDSSATSIEDRLWQLADLKLIPDWMQSRLRLELTLTQPSYLEIGIRDISGREIYHLTDPSPSGYYRRDISIAGWSSGLYFLHIRSGKSRGVQKILLRANP